MLSPGRSVPDDAAIIPLVFDASGENRCDARRMQVPVLEGQSDNELLCQHLIALHKLRSLICELLS